MRSFLCVCKPQPGLFHVMRHVQQLQWWQLRVDLRWCHQHTSCGIHCHHHRLLPQLTATDPVHLAIGRGKVGEVDVIASGY